MDDTHQVAAQVLETVPGVMRAVRAEMRSHRGADLTVAQFRALAFVDRNPGTSLSAVAEHIGLTLPTISKMVDGLIARKLLTRNADRSDRRRMYLQLTARGRARLEVSRRATREFLAERLARLDKAELQKVSMGLSALSPLFTSPTRVDKAEQEEKG